MKLFLLAISLASFFSESLGQSQDSVTVEITRNIVSEELIELRDSINLSLQNFDARIKVVRPAQKSKLQTARKELAHYYDLAELDLAEVSTTAKNAWTTDAISRISANMIMIRREHARLTQLL